MTAMELRKLANRLHKDSQIKVFYNGHYLTDAAVTKIFVGENDISIYYKPYNLISGGQDAYCEISESSPFSIEIVGAE